MLIPNYWTWTKTTPQKKPFLVKALLFFSIRVFFHRHWRFTGHQEKGGDHLLFHSTTSTRSRTLRYLLATLHVRWLSPIFNRNACVYQTATRWDLPPYRNTIWVIDWWCNVCLFTGWIHSRFFVTVIWYGNSVDLNSHRQSPLYYKWTDLASARNDNFSHTNASYQTLITWPHLQYHLNHVIKICWWRHGQKLWRHHISFKIPLI